MATDNHSDNATSSSTCASRCCAGFRSCLPRLLLILGYISYLLLGALVFSLVEEPSYATLEHEQHEKILSAEDRAMIRLKAAYEDAAGNGSKPVWDSEAIQRQIQAIVEEMENAALKEGPENKTVHLGDEWSFGNSLLFCMTTTTTIGYGHLVPHTTAGKVLCIFYTWIGIPLTLLLLADIGYHMAIAVVKMFNQCARRCCGSRRSIQTKKTQRGDHTTTDGAETERDEQLELDLTDASAGSPGSNAAADTDEPLHVQRANDDKKFVYRDDDDDDDALLDEVPLFLPVIIFWTNLILSAPVFGMFERWDYGTSLYFLFISVTTVGFGDFVPKSHVGLLCAWSGLLVTSMCFFLSYRKVIGMAKWVLAFLNDKLGVAKKTNVEQYSHI
ncbi:potassium channel subfamily K member 15-like [Diadema antillarum]|uniref:potassium channel subfamily K member 15-like n=1 Tax=Diadema antillarum TaxID=105358 RepID=UPI003A87102C